MMFNKPRQAGQYGPHLAPSHTTTPDPGWSATLREMLVARMQTVEPPETEVHLTRVFTGESDRDVTMLADINELDPTEAAAAVAAIQSLVKGRSATQSSGDAV